MWRDEPFCWSLNSHTANFSLRLRETQERFVRTSLHTYWQVSSNKSNLFCVKAFQSSDYIQLQKTHCVRVSISLCQKLHTAHNLQEYNSTKPTKFVCMVQQTFIMVRQTFQQSSFAEILMQTQIFNEQSKGDSGKEKCRETI